MQDAHSLEVQMPARPTDNALFVDESDNLAQTQEIVTELSNSAKLKMEVIQSLLEPCESERAECSLGHRTTYGQRLREAAAKLGKSARTVQGWSNSGRKKD